MKITKCDRCGAEMSINGAYTINVKNNNTLLPELSSKEFDLCGNCANVLVKDFMRGEWSDDKATL